MYICRYCKAEHQEKVKFCTKCGMKMKYDDIDDIAEEKPIKSEKKEEKMKNNKEKNEKKEERIEKKDETKEEKKENKETSSDASSDDKDEDPFVYKFDSSSDGSKKSGDGVWLAIVAIVVVIAIIIIGTSRKNAQEEANSNNNETSIIAEESSEEGEGSNGDESSEESEGGENTEGENNYEGEENEPSEEESNEEPAEEVQEETPEPEQSGPSETASSTLIDTSALRFDYSPSQVKDQDFSTAWIEAERDAGINEYVMVNYGEEKEIDRLGIVPGYGRDEEIYFENNRVKKLTLEFSDGSTVEKELEDKYAMHMLEFDRRKTSSVKVIINEVYSGSKYNDTAISEIDVDSDYVKNNDPEGALRFYEENKKANAKRPS